MKKNYEITLKHDTAVLIKQSTGKFAHYYPYEEIKEYVEVSCEFSRKNFKVTEWLFCLKRSETDTLANWYSEENITRYVSKESIEDAKKFLVKHIRGIKKEIETGKNHAAYKSMEEIVKKSINSYQDDFYYHDTLRLSRETPNKFLWLVRCSGSWLITKNNDGSKSILDYSTKNEKHNIYWYNGRELKEITIEDAYRFYNNL
jgi:hypothetical protein